MKQISRILFIALAMIMLVGVHVRLSAGDFEVKLRSGHVLLFNIIDPQKKTLEVAYGGIVITNTDSLPSGAVNIPGALRKDSVTYIVSAIANKAFRGADKVEKVEIPSSVKSIGDYAFEGCSSLKEVVFGQADQIFGKEVFKDCTSLENPVFGSKWHRVNLAEFKWSDSLKAVKIPASVVTITGLKNLAHLEKIEVAPDNVKFSTNDGMLYSADRKTFYACPCGRTGNVVVSSGTEVVLEGALRDCPGVEKVEFPSSLLKMSYLEFCNEKNIKTIVFLSGMPPRTALKDNMEIFALRLASQDAEIVVPDKAYRVYCTAICNEEGDYCNINGKQAGTCFEMNMASSRNIVKLGKVK